MLGWGTSSVRAQSLPANLTGRVQVVERGDRAKFPGYLLTRAALTAALAALEKRARRAEAALEKATRDASAKSAAAKAVAAAKLAAETSKLAACTGDKLRRDSIYERALKRCSAPTSFWKSPVLWMGVGAVIGGGVCGLAAGVTR